MRKMLSLGVVFVFLFGVAPVQAQGILRGGYMPSSPEGWYYYLIGDQVHMLQADNIDYIRRTMNIGRRAQLRRVTDDMISYGSHVGLQGPQGFYPMYQCSSKRRRWERGIGTTLITTAIGVTVAGKKGAAIGVGVGAGYALYKDSACQPVQNQMVIIDDPSDLSGADSIVQMPQTTSGRENGWNQRLRQQQTAGTYQRGQIGGRPVNNRTGLDVLLWVGDSMEPMIVGRGGHVQVPRNPGGMEAETIETAPGGNEIRRPALVIPNHDLDGWDIVVPAGR